MTSVSKKQYLEKKYIEFSNEIGTILNVNIFPSLNELAMIDILLFFQCTFWGTDDYKDIVRNIINMHHQEIDDETFHKIYPVIEKYINDLKEFLRTN
jgi:hypothetical protein